MLNDDTISAIATPIGDGGVGMIRISGKDALGVASKVFVPNSPNMRVSHPPPYEVQRAYFGQIKDGHEVIDDGFLTVFRSPRSYTGEDVAEITFHGGQLVARRILTVTIQCGSRLAEPGEFTRRAFLNGRIDLTQAEAVAELITASSDMARVAARKQMDGSLRSLIVNLREQLLNCLAHIEASIDFPEEGIKTDDLGRIQDRLNAITISLEELGSRAVDSNRARYGYRVAIVGAPNVGKSSLLNALLGKDRAIVSRVPGTTRDTIEELIPIHGVPVRIVDTAGLRDSSCEVEKQGIERAVRQAQEADLVLFVLDTSRCATAYELEVLRTYPPKTTIAVLNKVDLPSEREVELQNGVVKLRTSCKSGEGIEPLRRKIVEAISASGQLKGGVDFLINVRHEAAISKARVSIQSGALALRDLASPEFAASDLRIAANALGDIVGETTTEDILDRVFSSFCIGK